jgi:hypothetical protein
MARGLLVLAIALVGTVCAAAQQAVGIQWSLKVEESVAQAQRTKRPLMFWVLGRSASRDHRIERDQKRAFQDSLVVEMSSRFVPVRLSRSRYRDLLEGWDLSPKTNLEIVFTTPAGEKIDTLAPLGACDPETLARKMTLVFRHYREVLFTTDVKPKLEDQDASARDIEAALNLISDFLILSADQAVIKLLEREQITPEIRKAAYQTLAALSTPAGVQVVLEHAATDELAAAALSGCTPDAAEQMLVALDGDDPDLRLAVYHAVTRICKLRDVKSDRFWQGRYERVKREEIERIRQLVTARARRWRDRYAEYR